MEKKTILKAQDGHPISVVYTRGKKPKALVQILHGMAEHKGRYLEFIDFLKEQGFAVVIHDHRGHGESQGNYPLGYVPSENGWDLLIEDSQMVHRWAMEIETLPTILFSHSMGSLIGRHIHKKGIGDYKSYVFSGTPLFYRPILSLLAGISQAQSSLLDEKKPSKLWDRVIFGICEASVKNPKSSFDWISKDPARVQDYIDSPFCGYVCSLALFSNIFRANIESYPSSKSIGAVKSKPVLFISGGKDPVGGNKIIPFTKKYQKAGYRNAEAKIFPQGRHELLNEVNRREVFEYLAQYFHLNN